MLNKIEHLIYCGISVKNTELIDNDYLGLGYQIVKCISCGKEYIVFRNNNVLLEPFDKEMKETISKVRKDVDDFYDIKKNNNIEIYSNINEYIKYPIGNQQLIIDRIIDKDYGTEKVINDTFENIKKELKI